MKFKPKIKLPKYSSPYPPWRTAFSEDALRRAWLPVRANKGRGGSDGETIALFERHLDMNLRELRDELLNGRYRPRKVTQILVPKPSGKWRPITLWAIRDRVAQRAVYNYLEPVFESRFLPCSYGFRSGRKTKDAALAVHRERLKGARWVVDADIKDCFGQMQTKRLMRQLFRWRVPRPIRKLVNHWLRTEVWNAWRKDSSAAGTSQGGVISPLLCNLYLHPLDHEFQRHKQMTLVRYADDFVILTRNQKTAKSALKKAKTCLKRLGLEIHPHKTRLTSFEEGFQFVGWFFVRKEMFQLK